jgi:hypothetical protein
MRRPYTFKNAIAVGVILFTMLLFVSCNGSGDSGGESNSQNVFNGTYSLKDYSVQSNGQTVWASQAFETFAVDCVIHEDGFMEFSGCFKFPGEPEECGADSGMIEGDILTITEPGCTYSATVTMGDGNIVWEFPPSCGNTGDGPSVWHWTKVSDTTPKSLMAPEGELINMITESIKMVP